MRFSACLAALVAGIASTVHAQQYGGDVINNTLPGVPGSEITFFRVQDPSGTNNRLTLTNYYSHGTTNQRLVESKIKRAVIIIHGLNRDPGTYMSNMLSALSQSKNPDINFDTVAIMAPYFPNGDDKNIGYPWTAGLKPGRGSTTNALVWPGSQWAAGGNNQYPYTSTSTSSYDVLDQIIRYFDDTTLFPDMKQIVVAGHSLGAQMTQRYAAIGAQLGTRSPVSYWVANPNSYVWLSQSRPLSTSSCPTYDNYREGYTNFTSYPMTYGTSLVAQGRPAVLANFQSKAVNYARGTQDLGDDSSTCAPFTAGANRNERFFNFIKAFPPSCPDPSGRNCDTVDFVNAGHDGGAMMASDAGQARLFSDNFYGNGSRSYDFGYPRQQAGDDPFPNPTLNASAASINNQTYSGMNYWGCWSDQTPQTLTNMTYQSDANTIELCTQACASGNNSIAGLEFGTQCFCGQALGYKATQVIDSSCSMPCPGNSSETCGGPNRLSLFSTGTPKLQPTPGTPETVGNFYYNDCYTEATSGRALVDKGTTSNSMSLEFCASFCAGYQYFGTEYASECYCGNTLAAGANRTADGECSMTCANNPAELCGAGNRLTVYRDPGWIAGSSSSSSSSSSSATPTGTSSSSSTGTSSATTTASSATSSPVAVSCPASNNTVVASSGKNFLIECGVDHFAGDLTSVGVNSLPECIDACALNAQCVDVSLSGAACYLKSVLGAAVANSGVWGAKLIASSSGSSSSSTNPLTTSSSSVSGSFSATTTSSSAASDGTSSSSVASSTASSTTSNDSSTDTSLVSSTTSTTTSSGTLSSGTGSLTTTSTTTSASASASASSTPITCPGSNSTTYVTNGMPFLIECGVDHAGGDMGSVSAKSFQECVDACATTTGCKAVALSGVACYMKSQVGAPVINGVYGARLIASTSSASSSSVSTSSSSVTTTAVTATTVSTPSSSASSTSSLDGSTTFSSVPTTSAMATTVSTASSSASSSFSSSPSTFITSTMTSSDATTSVSTVSNPSAPPTTSSASSTQGTSSGPTSITSPTSTATSTQSSPAAALPSGFSALGCYTDSSTRLLSYNNGSSTTQTPQQCAIACQALNYKYSGTEYAQECWCSNASPPAASTADASSCNMACSGDNKQTCGAGNRLSVVVDNTWKSSISVPLEYDAPNRDIWHFASCYPDSTATRVLPNLISLAATGGSSNATVENCLSACQSRGFTFCGLEYYSECWGGNSQPNQDTVDPTLGPLAAGCNYPCYGNKSQACGGSGKLQVYMNHGPETA